MDFITESLKLSEIGSDFLDGFDIPEIEQQPADIEELQRTDEWFAQRNGKNTGSVFKDLMTCNPKGARLDWSINDKVFMIGDGFIKYCFQKSMERKRGFSIRTSSNLSMIYGQSVERFQIKRANEILKKDDLKIVECGFVDSKNIPYTGVSSDGLLVKISTGKFVCPVEIKSSNSDAGFYDRTNENLNEKHMDFWQCIGQGMVHESKKVLYIVSSPPENAKEYINCDDNLYKKWCDETDQLMQYFDVSEIHVNALKKRIHIVNESCNLFLNSTGSIKDAVTEVIDHILEYTPMEELIVEEHIVEESTIEKSIIEESTIEKSTIEEHIIEEESFDYFD